MQFDHFQYLHNEDSRKKHRSETLAIHLGKVSANGLLNWFHLSVFDVLLYLCLIGILGIHTY
jgi:hypothetical protein